MTWLPGDRAECIHAGRIICPNGMESVRSDLRLHQVYEVLGTSVDAEFGGEPCLIVSPDRPASVRRFRKIVTQSNECRLEAINV